jgi:hypothetical protein
MARNRRPGGGSTRRTRAATSSPAGTAVRAPNRPQWRQTLDSFGGFTVLVPVVIALLVLGFFLLRTPLGFSQSDDPLMGEAVDSGRASHVPDGTLTARPPQPPTGGPHYVVPQRAGIYDEPLTEGNVIHALEHGLVWISYHPDQVTEEQLNALRSVANDRSRDVILSPRPENDQPVYVVSWERRLAVEPGDTDTVRDFINTNLNRSPEPGVR